MVTIGSYGLHIPRRQRFYSSPSGDGKEDLMRRRKFACKRRNVSIVLFVWLPMVVLLIIYTTQLLFFFFCFEFEVIGEQLCWITLYY